MTLDDALGALATHERAIPRAAIRWLLGNWAEAGPRLLGMLDGYATGSDRSERTERTLFYAIHMLAERRDTAALRPLCRLLRDPELAELVLGDALTDTLPRVLVSLWDGDPASLQAVATDAGANEWCRVAAIDALAFFARTGRIGAEPMGGVLRAIHASLPATGHPAWYAWTEADATLALDAFVPDAEAAYADGRVPPDWAGIEDFHEDLRAARARRGVVIVQPDARVRSFGSTIIELEAFEPDEDEPPRGPQPAAPVTPLPPDPFRGVGRNDPCPCGSGRKFKKCCLPA